MKTFRRVVGLGLVSILMSSTARAALVTYQYTGIVAYGSTSEGSASRNGATIDHFLISTGQTIRGTVTYDTETPKWSTRRGVQSYRGGQGAMTLHVAENGFAFQSGSVDDPQMHVGNNSSLYGGGTDSFGIYSHTPAPNAQPRLSMSFALFDRTGTVFNSTQIPEELNLARFQQTNVILYHFGATIESQFTASILSLTRVNDVPEPSIPALLGGGLLLLVGSRWRALRNKVASGGDTAQ